MRKNKMMRLASGLLVAVLLTTCVISGTFAKYISEKSASDSARVAKWSFEVNDANIAKQDITFDLFKTAEVKDTDGTAEADVKVGTNPETIIAPGTSGSFDIKLENTSEVTAKYAMAFTVVNEKNIPIEYSIDGGATWSYTIADINIAASEADDATSTVLAKENGTVTKTVQWRWVYEKGAAVDPGMTGEVANDAADNTLGINANDADQTITVTAKITATQVD